MSMARERTIADDIRRRLDRPVVLVGMMGAGKTRLGRLLSRALALDFVDSDEEVEKAAGMTINEIFDRFGEPYFRDGEKRVVRRLIDGGVRVIATGGGAMMQPETADAITTDAVSIWIRAEIPVMVARATRGEKRPLLRDGDPAAIFERLVAERYATYARADITVESDDGPQETILTQALDGLYDHLYR
ncbi:MAG: shikimate kinase [Alphaproteobacteria bacterium]|nr:shikimate kinase [Alphaproteobacteria bacterium]MBU0859134.1 shikimate kinase [Alphaproteobacteria bacterium]